MFPKDQRIPSELFKKVYEHGQRFDGEYVYAKVHNTDTDTPARFSVVIPQSVVKKAVYRNRNKRRIAHALKTCADTIPKGYAVVVFAKQDMRSVAFAQIKQDIQTLVNSIMRRSEGVVENDDNLH